MHVNHTAMLADEFQIVDNNFGRPPLVPTVNRKNGALSDQGWSSWRVKEDPAPGVGAPATQTSESKYISTMTWPSAARIFFQILEFSSYQASFENPPKNQPHTGLQGST